MFDSNDLRELAGAYNVKVGLRQASEHSVSTQVETLEKKAVPQKVNTQGFVAKYQEAIKAENAEYERQKRRNMLLVGLAGLLLLAVVIGSRLLIK